MEKAWGSAWTNPSPTTWREGVLPWDWGASEPLDAAWLWGHWGCGLTHNPLVMACRKQVLEQAQEDEFWLTMAFIIPRTLNQLSSWGLASYGCWASQSQSLSPGLPV